MVRALQLPSLCLVADCSVISRHELAPRVARAVDGGVNLVQLRAKELPGGQLLSLALEVKEAVAGRAALLVNERVDVAMASGADGVQLGEEALPVPAARHLLPPGALAGRSVHSVAGAEQAVIDGADFLVVGTMFASGSHPGAPPAGPGLMREVGRRCRLPLIGIGGIAPENVGEVIGAGASGAAVIRSILTAEDPAEAAREMSAALHEAWTAKQGPANTSTRPSIPRSS